MPDEVRNLCRLADISSKSTLLQIVRQSDPKKIMALVERLVSGGNGVTRQDVRKETAKAAHSGRPKPFLFSFRPETKHFQLRMTFRKGRVEKAEIITALEGIIKELRAAR